MTEISKLISAARPLDEDNEIVAFARQLYQLASKASPKHELGIILASLFDLAVSALYTRILSSNGWIYCRESNNVVDPKLYYPFVNACPRCLLLGKFHFTPSRKPRSAVIGQATSMILTTFLSEHAALTSNGQCELLLLGGSGAVDAIAVEGNKICLLEIKSAPLVTFPLQTDTKLMKMVSDSGETIDPSHSDVILPPDYKGDLSLLVSDSLIIPLGEYNATPSWPCDSLAGYLSKESNLEKYVEEWHKTYQRYSGSLPKEGTFWLTNGSGQPTPRPKDWPTRRDASGFESVSDGKSSVGLDRTDDIKKGIYQVLKIGTHYKEFHKEDPYEVFTVLASNIHATKHHEQYLKEFEDMIWTIDAKDRTYMVEKDEQTTTFKTKGLYNLYDALITFTRSHYRNEWVKQRFSF